MNNDKLINEVSKISGITEQLDNKVNYCNFRDLLENGAITKIKLVGDSVTWGADSTGYNNGNSGRIIIYNNYENNHNCPCFANLFREYIKYKNPTIDFFNAGISGWSYKSAYDNLDGWIGKNNDVLFILLGINDRSSSATREDFIKYVEATITYAINNSNYLYVTTTPLKNENMVSPTNGMTLHDMNSIIKMICKKYNVPCLDIYQESIRVVNENNVKLELGDFYFDDLTHPADRGHKITWLALQRTLGFISTQDDFIDIKKQILSYKDLNDNFTFDLTPSQTNFYRDKSIKTIVLGGADAIKFKAPSTKGGIMEIINPYNGNFGYIIQRYTTVDNEIFVRVYNVLGAWTTWKNVNLAENGEGEGVIEYNNNWINSSTAYPTRLLKSNNNAWLNAQLKDGLLAENNGANVKILTLPQPFRPKQSIVCFGHKVVNNVLIPIKVLVNAGDGTVYAQGVTETGANIIININYVC